MEDLLQEEGQWCRKDFILTVFYILYVFLHVRVLNPNLFYAFSSLETQRSYACSSEGKI